jgi:hypothetical protein
MRRAALTAILLLTQAAEADTDVPHGRFDLERRGGFSELHSTRGRLPSCGQVARDFIENNSRLHVTYSAGTANVNSTKWNIEYEMKDHVALRNDKLLPGFIVQIVLRDTEGRKASGDLRVGAVGENELRCADGVRLVGTFKP